jgi:predicted histidine transporter YuiF (NhaC family)
MNQYGSVAACLTVAGIFLVVALITAAVYSTKKRQAEQRAAAAAAAAREAAKSAASSMLTDPMLLAAGLQLVRAVGLKKLIPLLAVGGVALGFLMSRNAASASDDEAADDEQA